MKTSNAFTEIIKDKITEISIADNVLKQATENPSKNIEDCVTYILNTVKKSGLNGFADQEIFDMAIEYYKNDNVTIGDKIESQVIINRVPELTDEEKQKAREKAFSDLVEQEKKGLTKRSKQQTQSNVSPSLFD